MKKTVEASAKRPAKALSSEVATGSRSHRNANGPRAADRIRASASELFYREGIRAVGVDEVVERAGVTKPSLYRSFASKDDLAAAYMRDYDLDFWEKFENPGGKSYSDPREHVLAYIRVLSTRAVREGYRGCGLSNATIEYPARDNPARQVAEAHKKVFRRRLRELTAGGRTALVSTHHLGTVERLADSVALLNGRLVAHGPVAETARLDTPSDLPPAMIVAITITAVSVTR